MDKNDNCNADFANISSLRAISGMRWSQHQATSGSNQLTINLQLIDKLFEPIENQIGTN